MASKNVMVGAGAALAGLSGLAIAAVTSDSAGGTSSSAKQAAPVVETRTVIVRTIEHRVQRPRPTQTSPAVAPAAVQAAPVVQPAPVVRSATPVSRPAPVRTRTSGSAGTGGEHGDDSGGHDD